MTDDRRWAEALPGARLDAALDRLGDGVPLAAMAPEGNGADLPRAYPAEISLGAAGGLVARFPDLPEAGETLGREATEVLARLPRMLLEGLQHLVRQGRALPAPSAAQGRPLVEIPVEALPRLLLHQRMLAASLDDAEVERRLGGVPGWSVAALRDPLVPIQRPEPRGFDLDLVMAALWVVGGGDRDAAFGPRHPRDKRDDLAWSRRQAALLALTLAGVAAPGLEVASAVDELGSVGSNMLHQGRDHLTRGVQLLMEAMAVQAAMGPAGEAAATLLLRRAAEGFRWAGDYLDEGSRPYVELDALWGEARGITASRLERLGLSIDPVSLRCPMALKGLLEVFSDSDITLAALCLLTGG